MPKKGTPKGSGKPTTPKTPKVPKTNGKKARGKKSATTSQPKEPKPPTPDEEKRYRNEYPEVYVLERNLESNEAGLAGYLGLPGTKALRELIHDGDTGKSIILPFLRMWFNGSKGSLGKNFRFFRPPLWHTISNVDHPSQNWADAEEFSPPEDPTEEEAYQAFAQASLLILRNNPEIFKNAPLRNKMGGYTAENWNRAYWLLKCAYRRTQRDIRKAEKGDTDGKRPQDKGAEAPFYFASGDEQEALLSADNNAPHDAEFSRSQDLRVSAEDTEEFSRAQEEYHAKQAREDAPAQQEAEEDFTQLENALIKATYTHSKGSKLTENDRQKNGRPRMSRETAIETVDSIAQQVRIIWPILGKGDSLIPSTEAKRATAAQSILDAKLSGDQPIPINTQIQTEAIQAEAVDGEETADRENYYKILEMSNDISAVPPTYMDACMFFEMDPEFPIIPGTTKPAPSASLPEETAEGEPAENLEQDKTQKGSELMKLKAYQVQFMHWAQIMENSDVRGFLLADDMGLGKTISILSWLSADAIARGHAMLSADNIVPPDGDGSGDSDESEDEDEDEGDADPNPDLDPLNTTLEDPAHFQLRRLSGTDKHIVKFNRDQHLAGTCAEILVRIQKRTYKPTLIVGPASTTGVWKTELDEHCPALKCKLYYSSRERATMTDRSRTLKTGIIHLLTWIDSLPDKPSALAQCVITSYSTWNNRSTYWNMVRDPDTRADQRIQKSLRTTFGTEDDDVAVDEEESIDEATLGSLRSYCPGVFRRIVFDEAQKVKSPNTKSHRSLLLLHAEYINLCTATPMLNKPEDLGGLLGFLNRPEFTSAKPVVSPNLEHYAAAKELLSSQASQGLLLSADNINPHVWLLDPDLFKEFTRERHEEETNMDMHTAHFVIPPILYLIQLRRTMAHRLGDDVPHSAGQRIGADIPPPKSVTIELQMSRFQMSKYAPTHKSCASRMAGGYDKEQDVGLRNMTYHRRLCHATTNTALDTIYHRAQTYQADVERWYHRDHDHGASQYMVMTRPAPNLPIYGDRIAMGHYIATTSVKLQQAASMAKEICWTHQRRVLIFTDWPMTQWNAEMFLLNLGFHVLSLRSTHKTSEREQVVKEFNDPTSDAEVLVASARVASLSWNLQHCCSDVMWLDTPSSCQTALQAGGRCVRIGQKLEVSIYYLTVDHTYDQVLQAQAENKMLPIISGQGRVHVTAEEFELGKAQVEGEIMAIRQKVIDAQSLLFQAVFSEPIPATLEDIKHHMIARKSSDIYQSLMGLRSDRAGWSNARNLLEKDGLEVEVAFRQEHDLPKDLTLLPPDQKAEEAQAATRSLEKLTRRRKANEREELRKENALSTPRRDKKSAKKLDSLVGDSDDDSEDGSGDGSGDEAGDDSGDDSDDSNDGSDDQPAFKSNSMVGGSDEQSAPGSNHGSGKESVNQPGGEDKGESDGKQGDKHDDGMSDLSDPPENNWNPLGVIDAAISKFRDAQKARLLGGNEPANSEQASDHQPDDGIGNRPPHIQEAIRAFHAAKARVFNKQSNRARALKEKEAASLERRTKALEAKRLADLEQPKPQKRKGGVVDPEPAGSRKSARLNRNS